MTPISAKQWVAKLLRSQPPARMAEEVLRLMGLLTSYLDAVQPDTQASAPRQGAYRSPCPVCTQPVIIDVSRHSCCKCNRKMVVKVNSKNGNSFLGCPGFPTCRNAVSLAAALQNQLDEDARNAALLNQEHRRIDIV